MTEDGTKGALLAIDETELSKLVHVADRLLAGHPLSMEGSRRHKYQPGRGMEFLDFQSYVPGGDLRGVDWRASARSRDLLIRRYRDESSSEWYVCLDRSASMGAMSAGKWMLAVQLAAAFLFLLLHRSNSAGLLTFSSDIDGHCPLGRGRSQYERAVSMLSRSGPREQGGGSHLQACVRGIGPRRSVVVISDFLTADGMRLGLRSIRQLGGEVHAVQVLSANECAVSSAGGALLRDIESGERRFVDTEGAEPEAAARRLRELQRDLTAYCRRNAIPFTPCDTEHSWKAVVIKHLSGACGYA